MSDERIITSAIVTTGEKSDGKYLELLVEKSEKSGMEVKEILADAAYSGKDNIKYTKENNIQLISKLNPKVSKGSRKKKISLNLTKMQICLFVPLVIWRHEKENKGKRM